MMEDNKTSILPDIITPISDAMHKNLPATEKQIDGVLSTVVGLFNNVVLYPVKKANMTFQYKLENFSHDMEDKTAKIPNENLQVPPTMLAGPILEALRYAYDEEELREMFENLLASSMDSRKAYKAHPSFVEVITQMSPFDAKVFRKMTEEHRLSLVHMVIRKNDNQSYYPNALPYYFSPDIWEMGDPYAISLSFCNLIRLGLLRSSIVFFSDEEISKVKEYQFVQKIYNQFPEDSVWIDVAEEGIAVELDSYGRAFADTCIDKEENQNAD